MTVSAVSPGVYRVDDGTRVWTIAIAGPPENRWVWVDGRVVMLDPPAASRTRVRAAANELSAPMPATVVSILVAPGAAVKRGETLLMLEAMKMELPVRAPRDGVIARINCQPGELVQPGAHLLELEEP